MVNSRHVIRVISAPLPSAWSGWPGVTSASPPAELAGLAANGVRASFLDSTTKEALLAEIAAVPLP
jgi:hypothetical protein